VLRPAKPVTPGKKIKCPKCENVFVARDEEDEEVEEARPRKAAAGKGGARKPAPAVKDQKKKDAKPEKEPEETYGYIKEPEDEDEDKKVKVDWEATTKQKDPRGPAIVMLTGPGTKLQMVGFAAVAGWVLLILLMIIPACFPIKEDVNPNAPKRQQTEKEKKEAAEAARRPKFFNVYGVDLGEHIVSQPWYIFLLLMIPFAAMAVYSSCIIATGIKMQNLESRTWGIIGSVMAILPINMVGLATLLAIVLHWGMGLIMDDPEYPQHVSMGLNALIWLISAAIAGYCLKVLNEEKVKEGFEYDPE